MAAEPKRSLRRTVASTVEDRSPRFLLGSLALAMVIALVAGLGIGIKVGEHNKKTAKPVAKTKPTRKTPRPGAAKATTLPLKGTVVQSGAKALVFATAKRRVTLKLARLTRVEVTAPATQSDIRAGSHVLFVIDKASATAPGGSGATGGAGVRKAKEIIIVSGTVKSRIGTVVTSATADSMTFTARGKTLTISTAGAKITKTIPGTRTNLVAGAHALVKTYQFPAPKKRPKKPVSRPLIAIEILVLPAASALA